MDILCSNCGEPWDLDTVLHDDPDEFKRRGCLISACPSCRGKHVQMTVEREEFLRDVAALAQICGSDIDGFASMLEDLARM
jgi:hypothetical protein